MSWPNEPQHPNPFSRPKDNLLYSLVTFVTFWGSKTTKNIKWTLVFLWYNASVSWLLFFVIRFFHCAYVSVGLNFIDICCLSTSYIPAQKNEKIANFTKGKIFWVKNFQVCETFACHIRLVFSRYKALPHWPSTKCFVCN